nr:hypothetical protein [Tanacetum cinerariifolium]
MGVEVEQDDLNQKFLTSLDPEWLMHTIVWRNKSDLDTVTLDDLYNHLKVSESEVRKKSEPNTQNMAFISSAKHSRGNDEVNTASVYTASSNVPNASAIVATVSISQETTCAYIASQSSGSQIKFEDINQIDEDDIEEMDIKWNMALLSMRADKFWKKIGKKISIQGSDVAGFDKLKGSKAKEQALKALMAIDGVGWDWSYMENDEDDHALVADEEAPTKFALMANTSTERKVFDNSLCSKDCKKNNDSLNTSKDLDNLIKSQRSNKSKEGLGYTVVPPPTAQLYLSPKKDLSWTGLPECADDTVTDNSRPSPTVESSSEEDQKRNPSAFENVTSPIIPKQFVKFVKASDSQSKSKIDEKETPKKPPVKYAEQYRKPNKKPNIRGNQRNWNNLKSHQLGPDFVMKNKACFKCGDFNHLAYKCRKRGSSQNHIDDKRYWDSGCSRYMTGNISYLSDYEPFDGEYVFFGQGGCKITRKGTIKTGKLEFENVYFVKDLKFIWTFFLKTKDETSGILRKFITEMENLKDLNVKIIRSLIKAARTMLADAKLPLTFWAEAVNTACYVQNRVLVNKAHNKTPYELFNGRTPAIGFLKPFGCLVMILNTLDNLGKFKEKGDEGYFLGYSMSSKAFRVFNKRTKRVEEKLHVYFLENKVIEKDSSPNWLFDIDSLTKSMNYVPVVDAGINSTNFSGTKVDARKDVKKDVSSLRYIVHEEHLESTLSQPQYACNTDAPESNGNSNLTATSTNPLADKLETLIVETPILTFEDILRVTTNSEESNGVEADVSNMETSITASPTPTLRIDKNHPIPKEEGIDYDEVFAPVARIEAIQLFLAYALFTGFTVYQMDVKSAFLYGTIDEEVYVMQPPGFQDLEGTVDQTLFIRRRRGDFILVQVYMDDLIFGSSNPQLCREFEALMHEKFEMSAMGELNFFLGQHVL